MPLVTEPINCDISVRRAIRGISKKLGYTSVPTFDTITLTGLTASRLISADANQALSSVTDLTSWVGGTTNQITVADDSDGTITLATPQDIHVDATPEFAGITIKDSNDDIVFYVDDDEMYFTKITSIPIVTGHGMPWLFWFTYTV